MPDLDLQLAPQRLSAEEAVAIGELLDIGARKSPSHLYREPAVQPLVDLTEADAGPLEVVRVSQDLASVPAPSEDDQCGTLDEAGRRRTERAVAS